MKAFHFGIIPKLALVFALFGALILGAVSFLVFENARSALQAASVSELLATAIEKQSALDAWVGYSPHLEDAILPQVGDVVREAERVLRY